VARSVSRVLPIPEGLAAERRAHRNAFDSGAVAAGVGQRMAGREGILV